MALLRTNRSGSFGVLTFLLGLCLLSMQIGGSLHHLAAHEVVENPAVVGSLSEVTLIASEGDAELDGACLLCSLHGQSRGALLAPLSGVSLLEETSPAALTSVSVFLSRPAGLLPGSRAPPPSFD